jgi:hypothetical protein
MKFGILKSKIENVLLESYKHGTFKEELKTFDKLVLKNKSISKLFYLYDDLTSSKGLNESIVDEYINESTKLFENTINKLTESDFNKISTWVKNDKTDNKYEMVDSLFSTGILTIESRIKSKKLISESLTKQPLKEEEVINVPISSMISMANNTISKFVDNLNESEKKEFNKLLSVDDSELNPKYTTIKESVVDKLNTMYNQNHDHSTRKAINETIEKLSTEKYDKLNYYKLKSLYENL